MSVTYQAATGKTVRRRGDTSHKSINQPVTRFRLMTGPLRVLPDYIIIGAQKCGTSSLYRYLNEHPAIAPAAGKEVHYFDVQYAREGSLSEEAMRSLLGKLGFSVAHFSYRLDCVGQERLLRHKMTLQTTDRGAVARLARWLEENQTVLEFRISPTGD